MALPSIETRVTSAGSSGGGIRLNLTHLEDDIEAAPSSTARARSSSRDSRTGRRLFSHARAASGHSEQRQQLLQESERKKSSPQNLGIVQRQSRGFARSKSGNDLRALVTSRNLTNKYKSDDRLANDVTGRPPLPRAGSAANIHGVAAAVPHTSRSITKPDRVNSQYSLFANPRSSAGSNSSKATPIMQRKLVKNHSNPSLDGQVRSNTSAAGVQVTISTASTPQSQRKFMIGGYSDSPASSSRPSTAGSKHSAASNSRPVVDGRIYRDVRVVTNSDTHRVTVSNISRKEKIVHIVHGENNTTADSTHGVTSHNNDNGASQSNNSNQQDPLPVKTNDQNKAKPPPQQQQQQLTGLIAQEINGYKVFVSRDNIDPPPTPRVGLSKDGEGLSMDVFMRCVDWLDGVHKANTHKSLEVVTLPPIEWND